MRMTKLLWTITLTLCIAGIASAQETVNIDLASNNGAPTYTGSGVLSGFTNANPANSTFVSPIKPKLQRGDSIWVTDPSTYAATVAAGAKAMDILGDDWIQNYGGFNPGNVRHVDSGSRANWVAMVQMKVNAAIGAGQTFQWNIWNEPDINVFWDSSPSEFYATWIAAYNAIKGISGAQQVVGPSVCCNSAFTVQNFLSNIGSAYPDVLDWHEASFDPSQVPIDYATYHAYVVANSLPITRYAITEYGTTSNSWLPGTSIQYVGAIERAFLYESSRACWNNPSYGGSNDCYQSGWSPDLSGLMGASTGAVTSRNAGWYAYQGYAAMAGTMNTVTASATVDGPASQNCSAGSPSATAVLGRRGGSGDVIFKFNNLSTSCGSLVVGGKVHVVLQAIANDNGAGSGGPTQTSAADITVSVNSVSVTQPSMGSDNVAIVTLTPASGGGGGPVTDLYITQNGGGSGASCANAQSAAFFNTSSNWGAGATIGPDTTVHLCGTFVVPNGGTVLTWQGSGTSGHPIIVKFETGALIQSNYCNVAGNSSGCVVLSSPGAPHSYLVLDGGVPCGTTNPNSCNGQITSTTNGTGLAFQQTTNAIEAEQCLGCEVKNMGVFGVYRHTAGTDGTENVQAMFCIFFSGSNFQLHDNAFDQGGWCVINSYQNGETGVQVYRNEFAHLAHGFVYSAGGNTVGTNLRFHDNHMHDFDNWDVPACPYHITGIHAFGVNGGGQWPNPTDLYIYNNLWDGNAGTCATGNVFLEGNPPTGSNTPWSNSGRALIYNNVANGYIGIFSGGGSTTATNDLIVSNTFLGGLQIGQMSTYTVENNGYGGGSSLYSDSSSTTGGTGNFNAYADGTPSSCGFNCFDAWGVSPTSNFAAYQANTQGQEHQSMSNVPGGTLGIDANYAPTGGSILLGLGTNLTGLCSGNLATLCQDRNGTARPSSGAWTAGAVQSGGAPAPQPPHGLRMIAIQ